MLDIVFGLAALLTALFLLRRKQYNSKPSPPGPSGYPLIGNVFDLPSNHVWEYFADKTKEYGAYNASILPRGPSVRLKSS